MDRCAQATYGGLDLAVSAVFGGTTAWVSDIDPGACQILKHRMPDVPNIGDLTTTDWAAVEPVDIVLGGYPCQPFSTAGKRKGTSDERHLWPDIARALGVLRPQIAVFENVANHLRLGFDTVLADLARLGFDAEWCTVRASEVGAPHRRDRLFMLATAADAGSARLEVRPVQPHRHELAALERDRGDGARWGDYEPAVRHWEAVLGRPAPRPVDDHGQLNPVFTEWLMGLEAGWVTDVPGLTRDQQLHVLGNGVVPRQAEAALRLLIARAESCPDTRKAA